MPSGRTRAAGLTDGPVPVPTQGRVFRASGRVRLGDVDPQGRARLDAIARWLQDVARDDLRDVPEARATGETWVVRSTELWIDGLLGFDEALELATFCGGVGARWAERRTSIQSSGGGSVEAASLWVCVDPGTGRPRRLEPTFHEVWASAAGGRKVSARRRLPDTPGSPELDWREWPLRRADFDVLDHVNNAAAWVAVDDEAHRRIGPAPVRHALVEHVNEVVQAAETEVGSRLTEGGAEIWLRSGDTTHLAAAVTTA